MNRAALLFCCCALLACGGAQSGQGSSPDEGEASSDEPIDSEDDFHEEDLTGDGVGWPSMAQDSLYEQMLERGAPVDAYPFEVPDRHAQMSSALQEIAEIVDRTGEIGEIDAEEIADYEAAVIEHGERALRQGDLAAYYTVLDFATSYVMSEGAVAAIMDADYNVAAERMRAEMGGGEVYFLTLLVHSCSDLDGNPMNDEALALIDDYAAHLAENWDAAFGEFSDRCGALSEVIAWCDANENDPWIYDGSGFEACESYAMERNLIGDLGDMLSDLIEYVGAPDVAEAMEAWESFDAVCRP